MEISSDLISISKSMRKLKVRSSISGLLIVEHQLLAVLNQDLGIIASVLEHDYTKVVLGFDYRNIMDGGSLKTFEFHVVLVIFNYDIQGLVVLYILSCSKYGARDCKCSL
jgi:hypothetical protein